MRSVSDVTNPADLGVLAAARALRGGTTTSVELVKSLLKRVADRNGGDPTFDGSPRAINAWARLYPEHALRSAQRADQRLVREGDAAPVLCGIPVGLKDMYAVEGLPLTASSQVLGHEAAPSSSTAWEMLSGDGAVLLGHTHTHEFAAGGTTDQVGNPWDLHRSAGGSSGGSAAALASGMVPAALGTDTAGSLRIPAALCGVSAFKPSFGRVSMTGVIPLAPTLDHAGPLARTLADCAVLMTALAKSPARATPWASVVAPRVSFPIQPTTSNLPLAGRRIALTNRNASSHVDDDVTEGLDRARQCFTELGAEIVTLRAPATLVGADYDTILRAEARTYHRRYAHLRDQYRGSTRDFLDHDAPELSVEKYLAAQSRRVEVTRSWLRWFHHHGVDGVLEPTTAVTAPVRGHGYDPGQAIGDTDPLTLFTALWSATGFPVATIPAGLGTRSGLPVSVSMITAHGNDQAAFEMSIALQRCCLPPLAMAPAPASDPTGATATVCGVAGG